MTGSRILLAAYLVGLIVRVAFLPSKPFWRDEAWVAALVEQPFATVTKPDWPKPVPIGFIALVKATARLGLPPQVGYRLVPMLIGLAALPLLAQLAAALGAAPAVTAIAVWLAAGMPALVYYSRELKSYDLDLFIAIVVPLLALRVLGRAVDPPNRASGPAGFAALLAALAAAPWISFGAVFPVLATLAWGWLTCWRQRERRATRRWLAATAVALLSFAIVFKVAMATQSTSNRLQATWHLYVFRPQEGVSLEQIADALERYAAIPVQYLFPGVWWIAAGLALIGVGVWPRTHRALLAWLFVGPGVATVVAALAGRYLLAHGRLLLFAAPPLLLACSAGLSWVGSLGGRAGVRLALAAAMSVTLFWSGMAIAQRLAYRNDPSTYFLYDILHDVDALIAQTAALAKPGEPVMISFYASRPYWYYDRGRLPGATVCADPYPRCGVVFDDFVSHIGVGQRGWLLLLDDERDHVAHAIDAAGLAYRERGTARGGAVWELTRRQAPPPS